tara:strand:- start:106 stop:276 length:171 start_codon:yes stop_codon:yes gene_type:complete
MKYILIFFFLISCSLKNETIHNNFENLNFSNDLTFEEFRGKLEEYAKSQPYPNIDN